jgi:hypothetical protein
MKLPYEERLITAVPLFEYEGFGQKEVTNPFNLVEDLGGIAKYKTGTSKFSAALDLDDTQFNSDIGMGAIMSIMHEESYWLKGSDYNFARNLKSKEFENAFGGAMTDESSEGLTIGKPGEKIYVSNAKKAAEWAYMVLAPDLIEHHKRIQEGVKTYGIDSQKDEIDDFCTKFHLLDAITMKMESAFSKYNPDKIVPRTRLTAGLTDSEINIAISKMTSRDPDVLKEDCHFKLTGARIDLLREVPGVEIQEELINGYIDIAAKKTRGIFGIVRAIVKSGSVWHTVSTGDHRIVRAVQTEGPYGNLLREQAEREGVEVDHFIKATRHRIVDGIMFPEIDTKAILAKAKEEYTERLNRILITLFASGDTRTDELKMSVAVKSGGIAAAVGQNIEDTRARFGIHFNPDNFSKRELSKILFVQNGK